MHNYFTNFYSIVNDLTAQGRRSHWRYLDKTLGCRLPALATDPLIADIGCGAGIVMEWLNHRGFQRILGVDRDAGQVQFAQGLGLPVAQSDDVASWLKQQPNPDFVVLKDLLEHMKMEDVHKLLQAIASHLRPGGRIFISVPNANSSFAGRWRYNDATHLRSYTEHSIHWDLAAAGFRVLEIAGDDVWAVGSFLGHFQQAMKRCFRLWRRLEAMAEFGMEGLRLPLGLNLIIVAARDE